MKDFFISYNKADRDWATWIAWTLEKAGYSVIIQAWDFLPGGNFVLLMQEALTTSKKTVMVLSEDYLKSSFTAAEWAAVFAQDPDAQQRSLIPVRVRECKPAGLLGPLIYLDLIGLQQDAAEAALLGAFNEPTHPSVAPIFPGPMQVTPPSQPAIFPGPAAAPGGLSETLRASASNALGTPAALPLSVEERLVLIQRLNGIPPGQFNVLLFALSPPAGIVRPMPAPQAERSSDLLGWAGGVGGCGLTAVDQLLQRILNPL